MDSQDLQNLSEAYLEVHQVLDEGMTMSDFLTARKNRERSKKRKELSPTRRAGIHTPEKAPERASRRDAAYGETGHGGALRPKKVRKAKALGELGEQTDIYDIILSHLLDEGYADTQETAEAIMVHMSEEWRESIIDEAYVDYKKGKLPSGRTPQQAAQGKADLLNAKERNRPIGQLDGTWGRQQHQDRITKEMGAHTAGNPISRAVRRGLGNMLPGGEPSTDRHRDAMDRRKRVADSAAAEKKGRG